MRSLPARLACLAFGLTASAGADPRFWWDDRLISAATTPETAPSVTAVHIFGIPGGIEHIVGIAYEKLDPGPGSRDIWLTISFDDGCSFCPPVNVTRSGADESLPTLALGARDDGTTLWGAIQVAWLRDGDLWVGAESATIDTSTSIADACAALATAATRIVATRMTTSGRASRPAIAHPGEQTTSSDYYLVWGEERIPGERDVFFDRYRTIAGLDWTPGGLHNLTLDFAAPAVEPWVSADALAAAGETAPSVLFRDENTGGIYALRSVDSGATFSPTGAPPTLPPVELPSTPLNSPDPSVRRPVLYAGRDLSINRVDRSVWHAVAWTRQSGGSVVVEFDARYLDAPTSFNPPWLDPADVPVATATAAGDAEPVVTVAPQQSTLTFAPTVVAWTDASTGATEIRHRTGRLRTIGSPVRDLDTPAFTPTRRIPPDPALAADGPLSACAFDEGTAACASNRSAGAARAPSLAALPSHQTATARTAFLAAWSDDRSGTPGIYFKVSDEGVSPPSIDAVTSSCDSTGAPAAEIEVSFYPTLECPDGVERMRRYLIYYGGMRTDGAGNGGPYRPIPVVVPATGTGNPYRIVLGGLAQGDLYHLIVVPEDEARNLAPPDFDPRVVNVAPTSQKASVATPVDCGGCVAGLIAPIREVRCVRTGGGADVELTWLPDALADTYNVWYVASKTLIDDARAGRGAASVPTCTPTPSSPCRHRGGVDPMLGPLYYQVRGACAGFEAAE